MQRKEEEGKEEICNEPFFKRAQRGD